MTASINKKALFHYHEVKKKKRKKKRKKRKKEKRLPWYHHVLVFPCKTN
jgi:hypothetical protein